MNFGQTETVMLAMEKEHRNDRDGGYGLVSSLCEYRTQLPDAARAHWDEVLLGWAKRETPRYWGVALEALAQTTGKTLSQRLAAALIKSGRDLEWKEQVANTLIRRGFKSEGILSSVLDAARHQTPMGLVNLAALLPLSPEVLPHVATCLIEAIRGGMTTYVEAHIPPVVLNSIDTNPDLLEQLVRTTHKLDTGAAKQISELIVGYLAKPFNQARVGEENIAGLIERVKDCDRRP